MMKIYLITLVLLPALLVASVPVDPASDVGKPSAPGPVQKKEFFGNFGELFSSFGKKRGGKSSVNGTKSAGNGTGIFDGAKKSIDDTLKQGGDLIGGLQSSVDSIFNDETFKQGTGDFSKGIRGLMKSKSGKVNGTATGGAKGDASPDTAQGIGDLVSGLLKIALPSEKDGPTLEDLGIPAQ